MTSIYRIQITPDPTTVVHLKLFIFFLIPKMCNSNEMHWRENGVGPLPCPGHLVPTCEANMIISVLPICILKDIIQLPCHLRM